MEYMVYANGVRQCPKCNSGMRMIDGAYRCVDCGTWFRVKGMGTSDKDLVIEEMEHEAAV